MPVLAPRVETRRSLLNPDPSSFYRLEDGGSQLDGGYFAREGLAPANRGSMKRASLANFMEGPWPKAFFAVASIQAMICLAFEA